MTKTTVYLPDELRDAVRREARRRGSSDAEVIREAIAAAVGSGGVRPRAGLFDSGASIAEDLDRHLEGFGSR